jgi:hypothetical protein
MIAEQNGYLQFVYFVPTLAKGHTSIHSVLCKRNEIDGHHSAYLYGTLQVGLTGCRISNNAYSMALLYQDIPIHQLDEKNHSCRPFS